MEQWHQFDANIDHRPTPYFRLPSSTGHSIGLSDRRGRENLVLFFLPDPSQTTVERILGHVMERGALYRDQEAIALLVLPATEAEVATLHDQLTPSVPLLADPESKVRHRYAALLPEAAPDTSTLIFVLDRYTACHAAIGTTDTANPDLQNEILEWLDYIELLCPE
jgi:peroxiredoxin